MAAGAIDLGRLARSLETAAPCAPEPELRDMAEQIARLSIDSDLFRRLSRNAEPAWRRLQLPVTWGVFIDAWIRDEPVDRDWLAQHSLHAYDYDASTLM